ncbi:MAG: penicillin-binding protein 2 [Armatimonadetes bacterium]|nr:penicillin-binding protein 2 [Armatimonadota bacterium]
MSAVHEERARAIDFRSIFYFLILLAGLIAIFMRLWFLQVVDSDNLAALAQTSRSSTVPEMAPRGLIVDRHGKILAGTKPNLVVLAQPKIVLANKAGIAKIAKILQVEPTEIEKELKNYRQYKVMPKPIYTNATIEQASVIAELSDEIPGFTVSALPIRFYSDPVATAHIIGYVGIPNDQDVASLKKKGVEPAEFVGKIGLEKSHELELMGKPGQREIVIDEKKRPLRLVKKDSPVPGDKLILGLDLGLQRAALEALGSRRGAAVAIDPRNGEILCLASSPSYDASMFLGGISKENYAMLRDDPALPLYNRAIKYSYAPGSTFKLNTTLAAELAGKFNPSATITSCHGYYQLGRSKFKCLGVHGAIPFLPAFTKSCNAYFMQLARNAGLSNLQKAAHLFGIGERTGIDLPGEGKGIAPSQEWIDKVNKGIWQPGNTVLMGIGQGYTETTALQMANLVATVANRGTRFQPHLVRAVLHPGDTKPTKVMPEIAAQIKVDPHFWDVVQNACLNVVEVGTARASRIPGLHIGGKTGSAENKRYQLTHSWFVAFAPVENPTIAIAVVAENAGHGGDVAAPIATSLIKRYLTPPKSTPESKTADSSKTRSAVR